MNHLELRNSLTTALSRLYEMEAFSCLAEFLQGELNVLYHLSQSGKSEVNPSILSDKLRVSRSRITAALSSLRRKGTCVWRFRKRTGAACGYSHA